MAYFVVKTMCNVRQALISKTGFDLIFQNFFKSDLILSMVTVKSF